MSTKRGAIHADNLTVDVNGSVDKFLGVSIVGVPNKTIIIDSLRLKLEQWAPCPLRNEAYQMEGFSAAVSKMFYISENYNDYPVINYSDASPLSPAQEQFTGRTIDNFNFYVDFESYKLFFVSVYVTYHEPQKKPVTFNTKPIPLIHVDNGNTGGCLDIATWWKPDLNQMPKMVAQNKGIDPKIYAMLTDHPEAELDPQTYDAAFKKKFEDYYANNKKLFDDNPVFAKNAKKVVP